jgi:methionyl-tRNA synthetase
MPEAAAKMREQLNITERLMSWESVQKFGLYPEENKVSSAEPLFPRVLSEEEKAKLAKKKQKQDKKFELTETKADKSAEITIEDFAKVDMRVATILKAEKHPNADKLLVLQVDLGTEKRQIVSGIADFRDPAELAGKQIVVVANLKPAKFRGMKSEAMIMAVGDDKESFAILMPEKPAEAGTRVK